MTYEWTEGGRKFSLDENGFLYEEGEPGNSAPQEGSIPGFVASEIFRLNHEMKVERAHREAAERQRDDKADEIRCLRAELGEEV